MSPAPNSSAESAHDSTWILQQDLERLDIAPVTKDWLLEQGLLTHRLREFCKERFRLEVLDEQSPPASMVKLPQSLLPFKGHRRDVMMWCDHSACIYARTIIPETTVRAHPWLLTLGTEPLGERLESLPDVQRSAFEFACLPVDTFDANMTGSTNADDPALWARRSAFMISDHELWVIEVFLPGLNSCKTRLPSGSEAGRV